MKTISSYFLFACLFLGYTSCNKSDMSNRKPEPAKPIILTAKQSEKLSSDNAFSFSLFRQVAISENKDNAFISPLSVTMALGMLYNGTSPDARAEMASALGMQDFSDTEINEYYQKMSQALLSIDPLTTLSIANSIWCEKSYPVKQSFIDINQQYYDAEVQSLDFSLQSTLDAINNWCARKTNNKIVKIIDEIPGNAIMYLINALYFKSKWQFQFDAKNTKTDKFTMEGGAQQNVAMMEQTATLSYYSDAMLQCVEMPYGNQAFSMVVILPAESKTIDELVNYLDNNVWNAVLGSLQEYNVNVKLPRFKQEYEISLVCPIKNLGMHLIFQAGGNLNGIADDPRLSVSEIKHKTFVEVNEEGTEAAAVTAIEITYTSVGSSTPVPFFANRPFIYLIKEKSTGAILFIGRMDNPQT